MGSYTTCDSLQICLLQILEQELTAQQSKFGDFNMAAQQVATNLDEESPAIQQIQDIMEGFNRRWNAIASQLNSKIRLVSPTSLLVSFSVDQSRGRIFGILE